MNDPGYPCPLCQVRPDVACRHRPADPDWSMGPSLPDTSTRSVPRPGQGFNFRTRKRGHRK